MNTGTCLVFRFFSSVCLGFSVETLFMLQQEGAGV